MCWGAAASEKNVGKNLAKIDRVDHEASNNSTNNPTQPPKNDRIVSKGKYARSLTKTPLSRKTLSGTWHPARIKTPVDREWIDGGGVKFRQYLLSHLQYYHRL